jgi:sulfatase maturation enzyme AslB (radical SAM superfamily)
MHSSPLEFARVCRDKADRVQINTNGSGLKPSFWSALGKLGVIVEFAIEGMSQETHEIYRRNTVYKRILENAKAFIDAGGHARWAMTLFRHNQHEVDECEEFANYLGFREFLPRKDPARFGGGQFAYYKWRGEEHTLYAPEMYTRADAFDNPCYIRKNTIQTSLYLSADQKMFPCCYSDDIFSKNRFSLPIDISSLDSQLEMVYNEYVRTQFSANPKVVCRNVCQIKGTK